MESSAKLYVTLVIILFLNDGHIKGKIMISPLEIAPACIGNQLELTCTTTGRVLEWKFTLDEINGKSYSRLVSITSVPSNLNVSSTVFTFSRYSIQNRFPLISKLLINPVSNYLNGTVINCTDRETRNSSSTTINIISDYHFQDSQINITSAVEEFESDGVVVTLEWIQRKFHSYSVSVVPHDQLEYHVINMTAVQLSVSYNTFYNVSIIDSPPCRQNSTFNFIGVYYFSCSIQTYWTNNLSIEVIGLRIPATEGTSITFSCPPGLVLVGNHTSVCMKNGEWEPNPQDLECKVMPTEISELQNQNIIIVVLAAMCAFCSVLFFTAGCFCRHYCPRPKKCIKFKATRPQDKIQKQKINLQENIAYINVPVQQ